MIIDGNPIEKAAMEQFHKGNRQEGLRIQEEFPNSARNTRTKTTVPAKKLAVTTATARSVLPSTAPIRSTFPTVCAI